MFPTVEKRQLVFVERMGDKLQSDKGQDEGNPKVEVFQLVDQVPQQKMSWRNPIKAKTLAVKTIKGLSVMP